MKPIFIAGANLQLRERLVAFDGVPAFSAVSFRGSGCGKEVQENTSHPDAGPSEPLRTL